MLCCQRSLCALHVHWLPLMSRGIFTVLTSRGIFTALPCCDITLTGKKFHHSKSSCQHLAVVYLQSVCGDVLMLVDMTLARV